MSLVIATNKDQDNTFRQEQSIYSAWSFKNSLSSVYKIPANSQVALQSCKVNLDGRTTLSRNNTWWYDYFGVELDETDGGTPKIDDTTSYPILQSLGVKSGQFLELTTDEVAQRINDTHREYHPNLKEKFSCSVDRNSGLDFLGYSFKYDQNASQTYSEKPTSFSKFFNADAVQRFNISTQGNGDIRFIRNTGLHTDPAVGIGLGTPLSLSNGSMTIDISNANASGAGVAWGIGLSRDCPNPGVNYFNNYAPRYFDTYSDVSDYEQLDIGLGGDYFEDFGIHRNDSGDLVIRHAVPDSTGQVFIYKEVEYWTGSGSDFSGSRYNISGNASNIEKIRYECVGEEVKIIAIDNKSAEFTIVAYNQANAKTAHFKPITQTCWCLHPVLFIGYTGGHQARHMDLEHFSGIPLTDYNSRELNKGGWFENATLLSTNTNFRPMNRCEDVDMRGILDPDNTDKVYVPAGLVPTYFGVDLKYAMILSPNSTYHPTFGSSCADLFGFPGRSLVISPSDTDENAMTFRSDSAPSLNSLLSVFVRLNGFGQQVMNARTGNKSTILAHLPTADSKATDGSSQRIFYEPKNLIWLDLKNPYEIQTTEFGIDFVYSNEQYAKILQGQSIVCLYFREKPKIE